MQKQTFLIETNRLDLRLLKPEDIQYFDQLESDPEVKKYFPSGAHSRDKTEAMIKKFISRYEEKGLPCFVIFDRALGEFIGRAGFGITENNEVEVGYALHKKFWGQGYASEALIALLEYAKEHIDAEYIIAYADVDNVGSTRVMEKSGMEYYKTDVDKGCVCKFYRMRNK